MLFLVLYILYRYNPYYALQCNPNDLRSRLPVIRKANVKRAQLSRQLVCIAYAS